MHSSSDAVPAAHAHGSAHPIPLARRLAIAIVGALVGAVLLRGWAASGLVSRGDDFLQAGNPPRALTYYSRAIWLDPHWSVPSERFSFAASMERSPALQAACERVATAYLAIDPRDSAIRWDRAICRNHEGNTAAAYADLRTLALGAPRDPKLNSIAFNYARRLGRQTDAAFFARRLRPAHA